MAGGRPRTKRGELRRYFAKRYGVSEDAIRGLGLERPERLRMTWTARRVLVNSLKWRDYRATIKETVKQFVNGAGSDEFVTNHYDKLRPMAAAYLLESSERLQA